MAFGGNTANIQLGVGRLWYAPLGTAEPTNGSSSMPSAWNAIGYTEEGSTFTIELSAEEVYVAEELDPALYINTKRTTKVKFSMAEATRKRLAIVLGMGAGETNDASYLEPPNAGEEVGIMLVWDSEDDANANDQNIRWLFRKCKPTGSIELARKKAPDKTLIPVEFNCEKPAAAKPFRVFPNADGLI